jgi:hypothetical protein
MPRDRGQENLHDETMRLHAEQLVNSPRSLEALQRRRAEVLREAAKRFPPQLTPSDPMPKPAPKPKTKRDPDTWTRRDGTKIRIADMDDGHLRNTILFVRRNVEERVRPALHAEINNKVLPLKRRQRAVKLQSLATDDLLLMKTPWFITMKLEVLARIDQGSDAFKDLFDPDLPELMDPWGNS